MENYRRYIGLVAKISKGKSQIPKFSSRRVISRNEKLYRDAVYTSKLRINLKSIFSLFSIQKITDLPLKLTKILNIKFNIRTNLTEHWD